MPWHQTSALSSDRLSCELFVSHPNSHPQQSVIMKKRRLSYFRQIIQVGMPLACDLSCGAVASSIMLKISACTELSTSPSRVMPPNNWEIAPPQPSPGLNLTVSIFIEPVSILGCPHPFVPWLWFHMRSIYYAYYVPDTQGTEIQLLSQIPLCVRSKEVP